uniref:Uncharacterized protein n=1 Tax=Ralstonia solanacearum TaxID=305 RepID=A0A0S4X4H9_RALSL|nr:protein of unknown function [Ralstonia solanacearum]
MFRALRACSFPSAPQRNPVTCVRNRSTVACWPADVCVGWGLAAVAGPALRDELATWAADAVEVRSAGDAVACPVSYHVCPGKG